MYDHHVRTNGGLEAEIMAEARELQGRHASRLLKAAARRLRGLGGAVTIAREVRERASSEARQFNAR